MMNICALSTLKVIEKNNGHVDTTSIFNDNSIPAILLKCIVR